MTQAIVNTIGLITNLIGVILLFVFGMPYRLNTDQGDYLVLGVQSLSPDEVRKNETYKVLGKVGLALIILGTVIQAGGSFLGADNL